MSAGDVVSDGTTQYTLDAGSGTTPVVAGTAGLAFGVVTSGTYTGSVTAANTIQEAVNAVDAGGTVNVLAGTYNELLIINKSVNLRGANAGIHPTVGTSTSESVGTRGAETILSHNGFYAISPRANNITIDGFLFSSASGSRTIDSSGVDYDNLHITNNIFNNLNTSVTSGVIQLVGGDHNQIAIDFNAFNNTGSADSIHFGGSAATSSFINTRIANNQFAGTANGIGWFTDAPMDDGVIEENEFSNGGVGMNIGKANNIKIAGNYFHDLAYTAFQVGTIGGQITGNTFEQIHALSGYWGQAFELWGGQYGTYISTNVAITNNIIHYNDVVGASDPTHGLRLRAPDSGSGIDASTIHVNNNAFVDGGVRNDAFAIRHQGDPSTAVDASGNWWGTTDDADILAMNSGLVDFTPFLASGTDTDSAPGFQGDFSKLYVTNKGQQTGGNSRIDEAADLVTEGGTVNVLAGTYAGNVTITKDDITIQGVTPNSAILNGLLNATGSGTLTLSDLGINSGGTITNYSQVNLDSTSSVNGYYYINYNSVYRSGDQYTNSLSLNIVKAATVNAGSGKDTFTIYNLPASGGTQFTINGNAPNTYPGDSIVYNSSTPATITSNTISAPGKETLTYSNIESVSVPGIVFDPNTGEVTVSGDVNSIIDNTLTITATDGDSAAFQLDNGTKISFDGITKVTVNLLNGDDTLNIINASSGSLFAPTNGIFYNGSTGFDRLSVSGGSANTTHTPQDSDADGFKGTYNSTGTGGSSGTQNITYTGLAPISDGMGGTLTVTGTAAGEVFAITPGTNSGELILTQSGAEPITFTNRSTVVINANAGTDSFSLDVPITYTGPLTSVTYNAGNDGGTATVLSTPATLATTITGGTGNDATTITGAANKLDSIQGNITVNAGTGGYDTLSINDTGNTTPTTYTVGTSTVSRSGAGTINYSSALDSLSLATGTAADLVRVTASGTVALNLNGGQPPTTPGDILEYNAQGRTVSGDFTPPDGVIQSPGVQDVTYTNFETVQFVNVTPTVTVNDVSQNEGTSAGSTNFDFTVTLNVPATSPVTINYAVSGGGANPATVADFGGSFPSGSIVIPIGSKTGTISIPVLADSIFEADQTFVLTLTSPDSSASTTATGADPVGAGTIVNDDATPIVTIGDVTVGEGDGNAVFTVSLSNKSEEDVTVNYSTADGTATGGTDYTGATGSVTISAGTTSNTISIPISEDNIDEPNETFTVNLTGASSPTLPVIIGDNQALATITDNDAAPVITLSPLNTSVAEGDSGTTTLTYTVTLSNPSSQAVTVNYATSNGTAQAGSDYQSASGMLTFLPGDPLSQTFTVLVNGDTTYEDNETFTVALTNSVNGTLDPSGSSDVVTITNDDDQPEISIGDVSLTEGDGGSKLMTFRIALSNPSENAVGVTYATADATATAADNDYVPVVPTVVTFAPGETEKFVTVQVNGDTKFESNEYFLVNLTDPVGATIGTSSAAGTINNDDAMPVVSINATASNVEGDTGSKTITFTVTLDRASYQPVTVPFTVGGGDATLGTDYTVGTSLPLTINPGDTTATITINTIGDTIAEPDETFTVTLGTPTNATLGSTTVGTGTILNDDTIPAVSIGDTSVTEGTGGTTNITFTVTLSAMSSTAVTISYQTIAGTATDGADYTGTNTGTLTIAANTLSQTFTIPIVTDDLDEPNETFTVQLTGVTSNNATILNATGTGTIVDDDATPVVSVTGPSGAVTEGNNATFTVNLSSKSASPVDVTFTLTDGTAQGGSGKDYDNTTFTVTIPAGSTSQSFNIPTFDDLLDEGNETFTLTLQSATNATIDPIPANKSAVATIADDDAAPSLSAAVQTQPASESGTIVYRVSLSAVSGQDVSLSYTLTGTATAGADFTGPTSGTVTIPAGQQYVDILVPIVADIVDEPDETVILTVTPGTNADSTAPSPVQAWIYDDDTAPVISVSGTAVQEGDAPGTTTLAFTISLDKASGQSVSVDYATADGTATAGASNDYTGVSGTVTFAPGETVKTVLVTILGDNYDETNETFTVSLSNPVNATVNSSASVATGTIIDDDATPVVEIVPNPASVEEGNAITFTVQTVGGALSDSPIVVTYSTSNGTAESGSDYTAGVLQTVTIPAHASSATFTVGTTNDGLNESPENFFVTLVSATNATVSTTANQATGVITDNDAVPTLSISDATVTETPGGSVATFTVSLSAESGQTVTVDYATANGTALAGTDYASTSGTLTFAPGELSKTISVAVNDDTEYDPNETFVVNLTNATHATILDAQGTGTITDDEPAPVVTIGDVSRPEGNSGTTTYTFTVNLDRKSNETIQLNYTLGDGLATTADNDYVSSSGVVTFAPGDTSQTIEVTVNGDGTVEPDETFTVSLTPVGGTGAIDTGASDLSATGTILNDDGAVFVSIADTSVTEPASGTVPITFTVTLSAPSGTDTTLDYTVNAGSTDATADFGTPLANGTVTILAGATTGQITFSVAADALDEADETFTVTLTNVSSGTATILADAKTATGTIVDNDVPPVVSVSNTSVTETDANQTLTFTINMSGASGLPVTVSYSVLAGSGDTATTGADFTPISGTATINPGDTSVTISIPVLGDDLYEGNETFSVVLTGATNATIGSSPATVTIVDDDAAPTITIGDVTQAEGTGGVTTFYFPVQLSAISGLDVAFDYTLTAGNATAGVDFSAVGGHLVIPAGQLSIMVPVNVVADAMDEDPETFTVTLSNVTNVASSGNDLTATGTITNDDVGPTISISDVTVTEGDSGSQIATFTVSLSSASGKTVSVNYVTADGSAVFGSDYTTTSGTLNFAAGVTSQQIQVPVLGDQIYEPNESFFVNLSNAVNGSIGDNQGVGTIVNNDAVPNVSVTPASHTVTEGNSGTTAVSFDIVLDRPSSTPITVTYTLVDGTATAADGDYVPLTGSVTFNAGDILKTVTLQVNGDTQYEGNEDFYFRVTGVTSGVATVPSGSNQGTVTITNDDTQPTIAISPLTPSIMEGDSGSQVLTFTVTLSNASSQPVTVNYATAAGLATANSDYASASGMLTFSPGETSKTISVLVNGDLIDEGNETFTVTLSTPVNATISAPTATATITDDDAPPTLTVVGDSVTEGNSGTKTLTFTLTLSHPSADTITLVPSFSGTASSPTDYSYAGGNIVFNPGDLTKTLTVTVNGDLILETDETVGLTLTPAVGSGAVNVPSGPINGSILNDDTYPAVSIGNASVTEGTGPGTTVLNFPVTLSAAYGEAITLSYSTIDGTAVNGADFTGGSGTVTIPAGQLTGTISIPVNRDDLDEPDETLSVQLTGVTTGNAIILNETGAGVIQDDDATPVVSVTGPVSVTEGGTATFTVSLSSRSAEPVVVTLAVDNGTAQAPGDFTIPSPLTVTIPAGSLSVPFTVDTIDDVLDEVSPETYSVRIVSATHATVSTSANVAVGEIVDNDATPTVSLVGSATASEAAGTMSFTVQLSAISGQNVMVSYQVASGTATAGQDFTGMTGSVMIPAGSLTATITVPIVDDLLNESNEDFTVTLTGATNATLSGGPVTGTITDNDAPPVVTVSGGQATEGPGAAVVFTITLASASGQNVTVPYTIVPGTATAADYDTSLLSGSVTFAPGQTTATVTVPVIDDLLDEAVETFSLNLGTPTHATVGSPSSAIGTIYDDDTAPVVSVVASPTTVVEGTGGTVVYNFTISLDAPSGQPVTVNYTTGALTDTATAGSDYAPTSGSVTFMPGGPTSINVPVTITSDAFDELDETLSLRLTGASHATISGLNSVATVTIQDDDAAPTVNVSNATITEGDTGAQTLTFTVSLSAASNLPITMNYATVDGTATAGLDYVSSNGTLTFAPGETSKTISVQVNGDLIDEGIETFTVTLSGITNATPGTVTGTGTINDNDTATISVSDVSVLEGNAGTTAMTFNVTLSTASSQTVTVVLATGTGTATAGTDYTAIAGQTVTFAPGETSKPVTVTVLGDTTFEQNETVPVTLSGASGATILNGNATGTIVNDDLRPTITVTPVNQNVLEGAGSVSFTVSLSNASDEVVSVDYTTLAGSALAGLDYTAVSGTLTFNPGGPLSQVVTVTINDDIIDELPESLSLLLSNPVNGTLANVQGSVQITDDDPAPTITLSPATVTTPEGNSGTTGIPFTVTLSNPSSQTVTVAYSTSDLLATAGSDYTGISGTLVFQPGDPLTQTVTVFVSGDTTFEPNETFALDLSNPTNGTLGVSHSLVTITNDDPIPTLNVSSVTQDEGDSGTTAFVFTLTLTNASSEPIVVNYTTADGTATTAGLDYQAAFGTLTFAPGETTKTVTVLVNGDLTYEGHETFALNVTPVSGQVTIGTAGQGTITNDDPIPTVTITNVTANEGDSGTTPFTFEVTLSNPTDQTVTINYTTSDGSAIAGSDYTAQNGTLTFNPGVTSQFVTVLVTGDNVFEPNEVFHVDLSGATNAIIPGGGSVTADGTITNDDTQPTLTIGDVTVVEGNSGTTSATFILTLSNPSSTPVTIAYSTADAIATAGSDYVAVTGIVTFAPGETMKMVTVLDNGDGVYEGDETFTVNVSSPDSSALVPDTFAVGTITNDDPIPVITISNVTQAEGTGGTTPFTFTVQLSGPSQTPITVDYATADGSANEFSDYARATGRITFAPGETSKTITVLVNADNVGENDETFTVSLLNPVGADLLANTGTGTIINDDVGTDLSVVVTDGVDQLGASRSPVYTVTVKNNGPTGVVGARVLESFSGAGLTNLTWTASTAGGATGVVAGTGPIDQIVNLPAGSAITYIVRATVLPSAVGTLNHTVSVTPPAGVVEVAPANNTATDTDKLITRLVAVGAGAGGGPRVRVYNSDGTLRFDFFAYESTQRGGVTVATGDVNGDGVDDIVTGAGVGGGPRVRVYDGVTGAIISDFFAYEDTQRGGLFVAVGDVNGDGVGEVITGAGMGGGPRVRVFDGRTGQPAQGIDFFAYDSNFRNGVRVAAGDTNGDGKAEIITGAGDGGGAHVIVWTPAATVEGVVSIASFFAYDPSNPQFNNGVYVAAGDVNGDGIADIITGPGAGGPSLVRVFNGKNDVQISEFLAYDQNFLGGVRVSDFDSDGDGISDSIFTGAGGTGGGQVRAYRLLPNGSVLAEETGIVPYETSYELGVYVG